MKKSQTLTTIKPREVFYVVLVLAFTVGVVGATHEPCTDDGVLKEVEYVKCGFFEENPVTEDIQSGRTGDVGFANVCPQGNMFCFPSTLPGFIPPESTDRWSSLESGLQSDAALLVGLDQGKINLSWSLDSSGSELSSGRIISCSSSEQDDFNGSPRFTQDDISLCKRPLCDPKTRSLKSKEYSVEVSSPVHVEVSPPVLDWGNQNLYIPTLAFVSVKNTHEDRMLDIYEPYSSSLQFYTCNFSEISLAPGEDASICFVFLPTWLGLSSAQIVLQTSYGGFLIHAKGVAEESPYGIEPLVGIDVSLNGKLMKNLSLFNPFNEAISVEELTAWISISSGNTSSLTEAICSIKNSEDPSAFRLRRVKEWLDVGSSGVDLPIIAMRPHRKWEVEPGKTETIVELDFSHRSEGKIFGGFFMQLSSSSSKTVYTVMVPLEAEWSGTSSSNDFTNPASVSLEVLMPCDINETVVVALSVRNDASYPLSVVKVSEVGQNKKLFDIKHIEGLILFPSTTTQVAVVTYTSITIQKADPSPEILEITNNCRLLILTNDSRSLQLEIPCGDVLSICSRRKLDSSIGYKQQSEVANHDNMRARYVDSSIRSQSHNKAYDSAEADELVLRNWKSQATASDMSVLEDHVIVFPTVQVGSHGSQWITVQNPSQQPVVMQLILNSAELVDDCRELDKLLLPPSSISMLGKKSVAPTRYGFSIAENAVTEAFVHPHGSASLGPIFFHPSNRCGWKSSALIRNNLSGVEWLSLQGFGGLFSLAVLEDSEPVQTLDFTLQLPALNFSSPEMNLMVDRSYACSQPASKVLQAKNTGDLPLEVSRIEVSGTDCRLDGFSVHTCKGFTLEPGESKKLTILYQTDFSAATVHRDLELALTTGILVVPMKASVSMQMLHFCKKSIFWTRVKKTLFAVFLACSVFLVIVCCVLPHVMAFASQGCSLKDGEVSRATVNHAGKSSDVHHSQKKDSTSTCSVVSKVVDSLKSKGEDKVVQLVKSVTQKDIISPSSVAPSTEASDGSDMQKELQDGNLVIKTANEKKRRRRKKRISGAGVAPAFEVSSSHSGNSTPSSPLSPATSLTPTRPWQQLSSSDGNQSFQARNLFAQDASMRFEKKTDSRTVSKVNNSEPERSVKYSSPPTQKSPAEPRKVPGRPVLLPSATFPSVGRPAPELITRPPPLLVSTSKIAPHAKAPGSKLYDDSRSVKPEEKTGLEEMLTYDIWGNHLFELPLTGQPTYCIKKHPHPHATGNNSNSFFVKDLQTLMKNSQKKSVSYPDFIMG